jgi:dihydroxy-acid dehydratase
MIVNVRPSGAHLFEDVFRAGGVPAVLKELQPLLHTDAPTITGIHWLTMWPTPGSTTEM